MELQELQFGHHVTRSGLNQVTARHQGNVIGGLQWYNEDDPDIGVSRGEIANVATRPSYQRQGVAGHMLSYARELSNDNPEIPYPQHSSSRSPAGSAWAAKVGGRAPRNAEPQSPFSPDSTDSMVNLMARS